MPTLKVGPSLRGHESTRQWSGQVQLLLEIRFAKRLFSIILTTWFEIISPQVKLSFVTVRLAVIQPPFGRRAFREEFLEGHLCNYRAGGIKQTTSNNKRAEV